MRSKLLRRSRESLHSDHDEYSYVGTPEYFVNDKKSYPFLGRFTLNMIPKNNGFNRILTVLARRYLFHNADGSIKAGDPYDRTEYARRALCARCSIPDSKKATPKKEWRYDTDYRALHGEFPELVDENGNGWYIRHLHNICDFVNENRDKVGASGIKLADGIKELENKWRDKVVQYQVPIFTESTKGDKLFRFDDCIADALEQGPLRTEKYELTDKQKAWTDEIIGSVVPKKVAYTLFEYYLANKTDESEWVILPQVNFDAYFGNIKFSKTQLALLPGEFIERRLNNNGVSMYRINLPS